MSNSTSAVVLTAPTVSVVDEPIFVDLSESLLASQSALGPYWDRSVSRKRDRPELVDLRQEEDTSDEEWPPQIPSACPTLQRKDHAAQDQVASVHPEKRDTPWSEDDMAAAGDRGGSRKGRVLQHLGQVDTEAVLRDVSGRALASATHRGSINLGPIKEVVSVEVVRSYRRARDVHREEAKPTPAPLGGRGLTRAGHQVCGEQQEQCHYVVGSSSPRSHTTSTSTARILRFRDRHDLQALPLSSGRTAAHSWECSDPAFLFGFNLIKYGRDLCHEQGIRPSDVRHRCLTLNRQTPGSRRVALSPSGRVHVYIHLQHQHLYQYSYHHQWYYHHQQVYQSLMIVASSVFILKNSRVYISIHII